MTDRKLYEVWVEGYLCTGMEGRPSPAYKAGEVEAYTFDGAVELLVQAGTWENPDEYIRRSDEGVWTDWGSRMFDNEADARRAFG